MNIVCASDPAFVAHMVTMLFSLVEHNYEEQIQIFVLSDGELPDQDRIGAALANRARIFFVPLSPYFPPNLHVKKGHVSRTTYARLLIDRALPADIERVVYLDCDLIVRGSLKSLWDYDLCESPVGAVPEASPYTHHTLLGLPPGAPYFNAGVMLIDLKRWKELKIGSRSLDFACAYPDRLQWWDQCALNLILHDRWIPLEAKWNFQAAYVTTTGNDGFMYFHNPPREVLDSVRIVHFSGLSKPWHYLNYHPMKGEYIKYRQRTPWPLERFEDRNARSIVRRFVHRRLPTVLRLYRGVEGIYQRMTQGPAE